MKRCLFILMACLTIFSLTQNLHAGTRDINSVDGLHDDWAVPQTAEARQELWMNALQQFLHAHPSLPEAKTRLVEAAVAEMDLGLFSDDPDSETKAKLAFTLLTIRKNLSAAQFREVLTSFKGLHTWLKENQIIAEGDCNCSGTCASGYSCQSTGCFSPKGTVNYGVCS